MRRCDSDKGYVSSEGLIIIMLIGIESFLFTEGSLWVWQLALKVLY